jgi:translation initiation factor 6
MSKALDIFGSPNVGLYAYTTDTYCLAGKELSSEHVALFEKTLQVQVHQITIGGSSQIGVFASGHSKMLLVPDIIRDYELEELKKLGIPFTIIKTKLTALGNNLIVNDNYCFHNPEFEASAVTQLKEGLHVPVEPLKLDVWDVVGSVVKLNAKGGLIQKDIEEDIKKYLEKKLQIPLEFGTMNMGSPTISGAVIVNSYGMLFGKGSAGVEISNADLAFGFLER